MSSHPLDAALAAHVAHLEEQGTAKGAENVIVKVLPADGERGPRYLLEGQGDQPFLKMNSNSYLGLSARSELLQAEEEAAADFGSGPGAVRFISGTYKHHVELERRLAAFHGREAGMIFSAAYATVLGVLVPLVDRETTVISDELNHNCIINAMRLSRPKEKMIYGHLDMGELREALAAGTGKRAVLVTDGIFSMRGSHAPLADIVALARQHDGRYEEGVTWSSTIPTASAPSARTGRGTEEYSGAQGDCLVGTLGKAFGVNGGYVVGSAALTRFLRETAPTYIYSNPDHRRRVRGGHGVSRHPRKRRGSAASRPPAGDDDAFQPGTRRLGWETIPGDHPVTPLMVRETEKTAALVQHLFDHGILATGLNYPVVPKGDQSIRFQINADHTARDIDDVLTVIEQFGGK